MTRSESKKENEKNYEQGGQKAQTSRCVFVRLPTRPARTVRFVFYAI